MATMYVKYEDDRPVAYAYGDPWVAEALFMDDIGFATEEEAKLAWLSGRIDGVARKEADE